MTPRTTASHERARTPTPEQAFTQTTPDDGRRFGFEEVLARAGISEKLTRQCEARGLIHGIEHADAAGRRYTHEHIRVLRFARRAYAMGFGLNDVARLLALWHNAHRTSCEVKHIALTRTEELESRIDELQAMKHVLERLANLCLGDHQPDCPILDELLELKGFARPSPASRPPRLPADAHGTLPASRRRCAGRG